MPAKKSDAAIPEDIARLSFEEAMGELETIVSSLEDGNVDLEKSIAIYERGAALKLHCEAKLAEAEARIDKIIVGAGGEAQGTEPLDPEG